MFKSVLLFAQATFNANAGHMHKLKGAIKLYIDVRFANRYVGWFISCILHPQLHWETSDYKPMFWSLQGKALSR